VAIKKASGEFASGKNPHFFIKPARDEATVRLWSTIDAYNMFPAEDGWIYEITDVEEKSNKEVESFLFEGKPFS
jgi:hypothetical protein